MSKTTNWVIDQINKSLEDLEKTAEECKNQMNENATKCLNILDEMQEQAEENLNALKKFFEKECPLCGERRPKEEFENDSDDGRCNDCFEEWGDTYPDR
jgi:DNA repair exonuclease SbcCD ATPase subunit